MDNKSTTENIIHMVKPEDHDELIEKGEEFIDNLTVATFRF